MAAMYSEMLAGLAGVVILGRGASGAGIWAVETATVQAASWFGSRGRLPLPMVMAAHHATDGMLKRDCANRNLTTTESSCTWHPDPKIDRNLQVNSCGR